ncbi:Hypp9563 [Branchiostoma lanceolatum]|uniref:Hypp9563 protein n=1 Tax=Branchiostoma lanceolatum TaxID=7740 RepID=A0A8S4MNT9_BRALA|nr:Hypp9563 [Branchiostoma lanceolatum]
MPLLGLEPAPIPIRTAWEFNAPTTRLKGPDPLDWVRLLADNLAGAFDTDLNGPDKEVEDLLKQAPPRNSLGPRNQEVPFHPPTLKRTLEADSTGFSSDLPTVGLEDAFYSTCPTLQSLVMDSNL